MWNIFEASINDDETLGNSFFTNGLFKISNEQKSAKNPAVVSKLQNNSIIISVDSSLILLEDESTMDCKFITFPAEINCFAISPKGNYIVCCLNDGNFHGVHIKGFPLFNSSIHAEDVNSVQSFIDITVVKDQFYILCSNGKVYKIPGLDEDQLMESSQFENADSTCILNESSSKMINVERISNYRISSKVNTFCVVQTSLDTIFVICCEEYLLIIFNNSITRIKYTKNIGMITTIVNLDHYIIGLTKTGLFVEVCPYTEVIHELNVNEKDTEILSNIFDLRILESNEEYIELLTLSKTSDNERNMMVIDFPSLNCKSSLSLPGISWLVSQPKSSINMYFIAGYKNDDNFVQSIELKKITEADPEQRFKKLLLRGYFEEAESYAKTCGLSLEPLYQAQVRKTMISLSNTKTIDKIEKKFQLLMKQLQLIEDKDFLVSLRLSNDIPNRAHLTQFLEFLLQNIDTGKYQEETNEINEDLLRLETLRLVDPFDTDLQWKQFLIRKDMQRIAFDYFKNDVMLSCLIWSRHSSSIIPNLNLRKFYAWLDSIRTSIEPFQLIQWLKHFAPCFLQTYPKETTYLVDWCLKRTRVLQFSTAWPEIGLEFINNINSIFKDVEFMFVDIRRSYHFNMQKISKLIYILEEMVVLKKKYYLTLPLDDYSKNSVEETAFKLLQRIQIQNFRRLVNDFLYPIFREHGLVPEETIVKYIHFLASNKNLGYWQERAVIAVELLNNEENRLSCALLILKVSPVPWSEAVLPLAKYGSSSNHPLANLIFVEYKNQAIKIIKIKYGWPVDYFDLQQDRIKLAFRIMKVNNADMIKDIKILVESSPDISNDAYFFLSKRLVELGRVEEYVDFINSIENQLENNHDMFEKTLNVFLREIEHNLNSKVNENYIEAANILLHRLKDSLDDFSFEHQKQHILDMKNMIQFRQEFNLEVQLKDLQGDEKKSDLMRIVIEEISKNIYEGQILDKTLNQVHIFSNSQQVSCLKIYLMLCQKLNNIYVTCKIVDYLNDMFEIVKKKDVEYGMQLISLMISQQISYLENNAYQINQPYDPLTFPLAYEFLIKCLPNHNLSCYESIMDLMHWVEIVRNYYPSNIINSTRHQRVIDSKIFNSNSSNGMSKQSINKRESLSIFDNSEEKNVTPQIEQLDDFFLPVLHCVCNAIKLIAFVIKSDLCTYNFIKENLEEEDPNQIKQNFSSSLETILKCKLSMTAFATMQLIVIHQIRRNFTVLPHQFVSTVNKKMLKFMLSQKDPEYFNAFIIFRSEFNKSECLEYLRGSLKNNSQRIAFSTFSEMYNKFTNNDECVVDRESRLKLYYYSELCKFYPSLRTGANLDNVGISDFLKDLEKRQLSIDLVKKLSKDFGWNLQKALIRQIKIIISQQELDFDIKTDVFGKEEVFIKSNIESIKKQCMPYVTEITDTSLFVSEMDSLFKELNIYFYELYLVVIDLIQDSKELTMHYKMYRNILLLLKHKLTCKRRNIEGNEQDYWLKSQSLESGILPTISSWRLPFKMILEDLPEDVISKDLNVESFESYYPLIQLHAALLCKNDVEVDARIEKCALFAAKNSVQDMRNQAEQTVGAQWNLKPRNNAFLQTVIRMVGLLADKGKALAVLYYIVTNTPSGCDQMEAANECWKFAMANEHILADCPKYHDVVEKAKRKYPILKTQHLLYLYGVADDKLLQMVEEPLQLIDTLYHHDSIVQAQKKEINKLCSELAHLHNIDLASVQMKLIQTWLDFTETSGIEDNDGNETVYEDFMGGGLTNSEEMSTVSDENVIRAYYILDSWNTNVALDFLTTELNSDRIHAENQLQLYECFAKLVNDDSTSYLELVNSKNYFNIRVCLSLKSLGFQMTSQKFETLDKVELLKKIWKSHYNNPKALDVMSLMCIGFDIHLPQIWNGILKQMVALKMSIQLSILVEILSTKVKLLHLNGLKLAWEFVIHEPLMLSSKAQNFEEDLKISKAFISLQKCPISTYLNLTSLAEKCIYIERPHLAALFVAFAKEPERSKILKLLACYNSKDLSKRIEEQEEFGVAPVITKSAIHALKSSNCF